MIKNELTVSGAYVNSLLKSVEMQGHDVPALLQSVDIDESELGGGEFSAIRFGRLYQAVMNEMRDESFGMISASKVPIGSFRMMCFSCIHAADLERAIRRCSDFYEILRGSVIKPVFDIRGESVIFHFRVIDALPDRDIVEVLHQEDPIKIRAWFSMWHHYLSWLTGQRLILDKSLFSFDEPGDAEYYNRVYQCPAFFSQSQNAIVFNRRYLELPLVQTEGSLRAFLKSLPYQLIVMPDEADTVSSRVSAVLGVDFSREVPSASDVADRLGMSISSLRRRLIDEGTSFRKIKEDCRQTAAMRYLASESMSIQDVAVLTGYDDPSTFFRAFKKWAGMTPGEYRKQLR